MSINPTGLKPHPSAMLDVSDTARGVLVPRLSNAQMLGISTPANALLVYNTDSVGFYFFNGTNWVAVANSDSSGISEVLANNNNASDFGVINLGHLTAGVDTIHPEVVMDLFVSNKAFLPPRLNITEIMNIADPVEGMMVYNRTARCPFYYNGLEWLGNCGSTVGLNSVSGNAFTSTSGGSTNDDRGTSIHTDSSGNYYVAGYFQNTFTLEGSSVTSAGNTDVFVAKYDVQDSLHWLVNVGGGGEDMGFGVTTDEHGNVYVTGHFSGTADFDPGVGVSTLTSAGARDAFILKLNPNGAYDWAIQGGAGTQDYAYGISSDGDFVYACGSATGNAGFGSESIVAVGTDGYVVKVDTVGNVEWMAQLTGTGALIARDIEVSPMGHSYVVGDYEGTASFAGFGPLVSTGNKDVFICRLDSSGLGLWATGGGSASDDLGHGIGLDEQQSSTITGVYSDDFTVSGNTLTNSGNDDVFVVQFDSTGSYQWSAKGSGDQDASSDDAHSIGNRIYITGKHKGTLTIAGSPLSTAGNEDVFLACYLQDGTALWGFSAGSPGGNDGGLSVTHGANESDIRCTGYFENTADFGGNSQTSSGGEDVFIWIHDGS